MADDFIFERPAWHKRANCRGKDPEIFFPKRGESLDAAREICKGCPVKRDCRIQSIEFNEYHGVWAGEGREGRAREVRSMVLAGKLDEKRIGCRKSGAD